MYFEEGSVNSGPFKPNQCFIIDHNLHGMLIKGTVLNAIQLREHSGCLIIVNKITSHRLNN
jgi:hypothetical protein